MGVHFQRIERNHLQPVTTLCLCLRTGETERERRRHSEKQKRNKMKIMREEVCVNACVHVCI